MLKPISLPETKRLAVRPHGHGGQFYQVVLKNPLMGETVLTTRDCLPSQDFSAITMSGTKRLTTVEQVERVMKSWEKFVEESDRAETKKRSR